MDLFTNEDLKVLCETAEPPCVSLFMPTHPGGVGRQAEADPVRWRNHLTEAEELLVARGLRAPVAREFLAPAHRLTEESTFWKTQSCGLACFLAPQFLKVYRLPAPSPDLVVVADRFQVTPLLPLFGEDSRFFVLAISRNAVRFLKGSRYDIREIDLSGVPQNQADALLTHDRDEVLTFHSRPTSGGTWGAIFGGQGVGIDTAKDDLLLFFQQVNRGLHALLRTERFPLILAAVEYQIPIYRQANTYPFLLEQGIEGNPDRLSTRELHARAWELVRPTIEQARKSATARYLQLAGTGYTVRGLQEVLPAALEGRIETLFITANRQCWGKCDPTTGQVIEHKTRGPGDEDLLNLAAVWTLGRARTVYVVDPMDMPSGDALTALLHRPSSHHGGKRP